MELGLPLSDTQIPIDLWQNVFSPVDEKGIDGHC